jgi:hypothetical protein
MKWLLLLPFILQAFVIAIDEFYFHWKRGLPLLERIGHPLDVCTLMACFGWILTHPYSDHALMVYAGLAIFSCLFVTKEEWLHARLCGPGEQWIHSLLFLLQPAALISAGVIWAMAPQAEAASHSALQQSAGELYPILSLQLILQGCFLAYQFIYWGFLRKFHVKTFAGTQGEFKLPSAQAT